MADAVSESSRVLVCGVAAMRHSLADGSVGYQWERRGSWEGFSIGFEGASTLPSEDSEEAFITEHYWGYARQSDQSAVEYQVEHPRWRVWRGATASLECDVHALYGSEFVEALSRPPSTAFVADGSAVIVRRGRRFPAG